MDLEKQERRVSHAVVGHIFIDDFLPLDPGLDPTLLEVRNPHEILLVV
jgi:hypothetical protein